MPQLETQGNSLSEKDFSQIGESPAETGAADARIKLKSPYPKL
jgi:hypothetical protein